MSSVPLRARSPFFAFDAETGSRRPRWATFVAGLIVMLLVSAGIVAGVSAANAHTPKVNADCYQVNIDLKSYNGTNHIYVVINGEVKADKNFGNGLTESYKFADPTKVNTWTVIVTAHDDPNFDPLKGWSVKRENKTTTPCAAPDLTLAATVCNTVGGTTTVTATVSQLVEGQTYTGKLFKNDVELLDTFVATTAGKSWTGLAAGAKYTLTVTSDQQPGLKKTVETFVVGCPQNSQLQVTANQCTATDTSNASVSVTASSLVPGRSYVARVHKDGAAYGGLEFAFVAGAGETSKNFSINGIPENLSGLTVVLTDVAAATLVTSTGFSTNPCPDIPAKPQVTVQQCTAVDGDLELTVTPTGLVPTRTYLVLINDVQVDEFTPATSNEAPRTYPLPSAGTYTVKIVDKLVTTVFAAADPIDVHDCPTQPLVSLTPTQCDVPGGTGSLTASFSDLGVGREYLVTITEGAGSSVPGYTTPLTVTSASAPQVYSGLDVGKSYTVTIADKALPGIKDAASETLVACPQTPGIVLDLRCLLIEGESLIEATINDLDPGAEYQVDVIATTPPPAPGGVSTLAVAVISSQTITGGATPTELEFQVPNNVTYTITVTHLLNPAITSSAEIFAAICDLPTFPLPELPTLALTGAGDTTMPMLGALGLVQFGVALLALAAMLQFAPRRRVV
jgi:hypothetical protein